MNGSISTRRLRPPVPVPPVGALDVPVLRVRAKFGQTWATAGTGFLIQEWPSCVITARHVVALADGTPPSDLIVSCFTGGRFIRFQPSVVSFPSGDGGASDIGIVRLNASLKSSLRLAKLDGQEGAQIWGYPAGDETSRRPLVVATRATASESKISLENRGRVGMSGGPIVVAPTQGAPIAVVGVYLGYDEETGARGLPAADESVFVCKDAAMMSK